MIAFLILGVAAVACASKLAYNYTPVGHTRPGLSLTAGSVKDKFSSSSNSPARLSDGLSPPVSHNVPVNFSGYQTEFYTFTAPEDVFDDPVATKKYAGSLKKKIRVIFIKSPENNAYENAVLALVKQAVEQKTVIYVLNRQHDASDLAKKFNAASHNFKSKPAVHIVKYRTSKDAFKAQADIQSQYDSLGGSTQKYNGGIAPVLNFASQAPQLSHLSIQTPNDVYLPSSDFKSVMIKILKLR